MIGSLLVRTAEQKCAISLESPLSTMQISSLLSTITPTERSLSNATLIFWRNEFTNSLPFLILCSSSLRFKMLAYDVEMNLCSKVFHTSLELMIPTTNEKTCVVKVELIRERSALSLIFQAWNSGLATKVAFPTVSSAKGDGYSVVPSMCSINE